VVAWPPAGFRSVVIFAPLEKWLTL
jgi:hypothetical protein